MEEKTFMTADGITVTSSRIDIHGQTFAVRNIGSVKVTSKGFSLILTLLGVLFALSGLGALGKERGVALVLIGLAALCFWALWERMSKRRLVLVTGGGEVTAYTSSNRAFVEQLRAAIANAISVR